MTKKSVLFVSGILVTVLVFLEYLGTYRVCDFIFISGHEGGCPFVMSGIESILFPIIPLFLFSLITYKMSEVVFQDWWRFARIFVPLAMFLILITPAYTHNWMFPVVKGTVAVALSALFIIISLFRITLTHRRIKQGNS